MVNLLILIGALLVAFRIVGPFLRVVISLLMGLLGLTIFIALVIVLFVAMMTHGAFI